MNRATSPHLVSFQAAAKAFREGKDTPRDFLERAIDKLEATESTIRAFTALSLPRARIAADAATARWREGRPWSRIDGMPIGIKDIIDTFDMPTGLGSPTSETTCPAHDAASVFALREAGAAVLGKTKTTEFAGANATDTRNPLDALRTPGGSSAGSAAAVGAGVLPVALGTQVIGSILRPASFCGAFGYKPSYGAINRGGSHDLQSQSCIGFIGATLADIWCTAHEVAQRAGGDPGEFGLEGGSELAAAAKPVRLIHLQVPDWDKASAVVRQQFDETLSRCSANGVQILNRANSGAVKAFEQALAQAFELALDIVGYESRWPLKSVAYHDRMGISHAILARLARSDDLGLEGYRLLLKQRAELRRQFEGLMEQADGVLTLTAPGAAPRGLMNTGNSKFTVPASLLGVPALSLPMMLDEGLPVGLQLIGGQQRDTKVFAIAAWLLDDCGDGL